MNLLHILPDPVRENVDWESLVSACSNDLGPQAARCRIMLKEADQLLFQAFRDGVGITQLVHGRARIMDFVLGTAWQALGLAGEASLALAAVGGYGRGELHPGSDIDIMVLREAQIPVDLEEALMRFITLLWDLGLPVGHSVRTLDECVEEAAADITVVTNVMESRLLAGNPALFEAMRERTGPDHIWPDREFFKAKLEEKDKRYSKFGNSAYKLEPNVKEGPGGLRDIQMVGWVAKRHLQAENLHELVNQRFLTEDEFSHLMKGQDWLWRVRFALHMLTGRTEDRLLFDQQVALAELFGYRDQDHNLAVEQFMQFYYRTVMELERLNEMLLQHYQEVILYPERDAEAVPINRRFQSYKCFLEVTREDVFRRSPSALLELFLILQQHPELQGVRASTIRLVRSHLHLIDEDFREDLANRSLFMEMLRQPVGITHEFRRMNRYGVLARYLPAFARIVGRMQYDLFHIYTVDEHTLIVLRNLRRFTVPEHAHELPFCSLLVKRIPKLEILYIAALFHDIAKGRGGDHSELGAEDARAFCIHHGLGQFDTNKVAWLVRNHLLMSVTAQRKDINDPDIINGFARTVGNANRLNYLYLLTVADIRATNPKLWNSWKESLLGQLYRSTLRAIRRGLDNPLMEQELLDEARATALQILEKEGCTRQIAEELWTRFSRNYFLRHSGDEIAWHTCAIHHHGDSRDPLVLVRQHPQRGTTEIFIYTPDHNHLFARITAALSALGLNILDARIITASNGYTLDTFQVLDEEGQCIVDPDRISGIKKTLRDALGSPGAASADSARRLPRRVKHFQAPPRISFSQDPKSGTTRMELVALDEPGLLCRVGRALVQSEVLVYNARIATLGAQAEDIFYITDLQRRPITEPSRLQRIQEKVRDRLTGQAGAVGNPA